MATEQVVIIGGGPSGLATALQLIRYGIKPVLLERDRVGGLLHNANLVENYPGFPEGIPGPELVALFEAQRLAGGVEVTTGEAREVSYADGVFQIATAERVYQAQALVVASGTTPKPFTGADFSIPEEAAGFLFYEVYPLLEVEGKQIAIVGGGDAAFDYALNLCERNHVIILNRGEGVQCLPLLWERASAAPRITYHQNTRIARLESYSGGIRLDCANAAGDLQFFADYVIGAIGRRAQLDFMAPDLMAQASDLEAQGSLYFVGDVKRGIYRQTAIAVGDGILAAMKIYRHLKENPL